MDNENNQMKHQNNYMVCPNCKQNVLYGSAFCNYCGFNFQHQQQPNYQQNTNQQYATRKPSGCFAWFVSAFIFVIIWLVLSSAIKNRKEEISEDQVDESAAVYTESEEITETTTEEYTSELTVFSPQTLYNENGCVIKLVSGDDKSIQFCFENNTDMNLGFKMIAMSINGTMCDYFDVGYRVSAGTKLTESYEISDVEYVLSDYIEYADFLFWIVDYENISTDFTTPVLNAKTNMYKKDYLWGGEEHEFSYDNVDLLLIHNSENSTMYALGNRNDDVVYVNFENYTVNGCSMQNEYIPEMIIFPQQSVNVIIAPSDQFRQLNNISSIETVDLQLSVVHKYFDYTTDYSDIMNVVK